MINILKKSYKGLVLWFVLFIAGMFLLAMMDLKESIGVPMIELYVCYMITLLSYMIYRTENIYWYNGVTYEVASKVSQEERKRYAYAHFKRFGLFSLFASIILILVYVLSFSYIISIVVMVGGLIITAISTMNIHLNE